MSISEADLRRVKQATDIVQLLSEYTPLKKSGRNYAGCCPFHQERTPSMYVYIEDQGYHCFGCGAHGDAITLVREKERLSFVEAVEFLARRAGITIERQDSPEARRERGERERLLAVMEFATVFCERMLWESAEGTAARDYLAGRRLGMEVCKRFRVGWAPGGSKLLMEARRAGLAVDDLVAADVAIRRDDGSVRDRFYERVTFPICDRFGHPIAISARLLPAAERAAKEAGRGVGKYVNSTETPLYRKSHAVFNLHRARQSAKDRLIVMEGPTDVMAADQAGVDCCVAALGTALTGEHARQLGQLMANRGDVILLLDGDRAGQTQSIRAVGTCLAAGVPVRIAVLPDELDPAELLAEGTSGEGSARGEGSAGGEGSARSDGVAVLERVLASARHDVDHLLRAVAPRPHALDRRDLMAVADQVLAALKGVPDPELRALHLRDAETWLGLERGLLAGRLARGDAPKAEAAPSPAATPALPALSPEQEIALRLLMRQRELRAWAADTLELEGALFPPPWDAVASALLLDIEGDVEAIAAAAGVPGDPALRDRLLRWAMEDPAALRPAIAEPRDALARAAQRLRLPALHERLRQLAAAIEVAQRDRDFAAASRLAQERAAAQRTLHDLER